MTRSLRLLVLLAAVALAAPTALAQDCTSDVLLFTQAQVDAFDCDSVAGNLFIFGGDAITSLGGLSELTSVGGNFFIHEVTTLTSLDGLGALASVGSRLSIDSNTALTSLDGLESLTSAGGGLGIARNPALSACACGLIGLATESAPGIFEFVGLSTSISANAVGGTCSSADAALSGMVACSPSVPPVANAGPPQTVIAGQTVTLDGTSSSDPDEDPLTFAWTLASARLSGADTASPSFCAAEAVTYTAELVVNDGTVDSETDDVTVTALSVDDAIAALIADIDALVAAGDLRSRYARALTNRLDQARRHLNRGRSADAMFRTVETRIGTYVRIDALAQAQADALVTSLDAITGVLASPCSDTTAIGDDPFASATLNTEAAFGLAAPYPNPTTGRATIAFTIEDATDVRLAVYDALGRQVALLAEGPRSVGRHELTIDGAALETGTYLVRLTTADGQVATHRLTLLR